MSKAYASETWLLQWGHDLAVMESNSYVDQYGEWKLPY